MPLGYTRAFVDPAGEWNQSPPRVDFGISLEPEAEVDNDPVWWATRVSYYQNRLFPGRAFSDAERHDRLMMARLGETADQWAARMGGSAEDIADLASRRHRNRLGEWVTKTAETTERLWGVDDYKRW